MIVGDIIHDAIGTLIQLSPLAALGSFVLAGLSLRKDGGTNFQLGGGVTLWLTWTAIFLSLPQIVPQLATWAGFSAGTLPTSGTTGSAIVTAVNSFLQYVGKSVLPVVGGVLVFKAMLDQAQGQTMIPSLVSALLIFALTTAISSSSGLAVSSSTFDASLTSYLTYATGTLCPILSLACLAAAVVLYPRGDGRWKVQGLASMGFASISAITTALKAYEGQ